jgi:hypothetical protein
MRRARTSVTAAVATSASIGAYTAIRSQDTFTIAATFASRCGVVVAVDFCNHPHAHQTCH